MRHHKYNARAITLFGHTFPSQAEGMRYLYLKECQEKGEISELTLQPRYVLQESFRDATGKAHRAITYVGDFQYQENGRRICEDVKGVKTAAYRLKAKLLLARYPDIELREVMA